VLPEDEAYVLSLQAAWVAAEIDWHIDMGPAFYRRGQDFYKRRDYAAAIADFDRATELGVTGAIDRKEIALQVMVELMQREGQAAKLRQVEVEQSQREAEAERQRFVEERLREAEENTQGKLFTFETVFVNKRGRIDRREQKKARCLSFDVGNGVSLEMVYVPGGTFLMGDTKNVSSEQPIHEVTVPNFHLGKYPVTRSQYQAVMGQNPAHFKGDNLPVESVSWQNAVAFCQKLSQQTGRQFQLASEAQWEYACRAGTTTKYCYGNTLTCELANFDGKGQTSTVGSFPPNAFGLYDMHGNVWEWCLDTWHGNYQGSPGDGSAWQSQNENDSHVLRGGSWINDPRNCRSAIRFYCNPDFQISIGGFRVCLAVART
jgi:formylglycine-generating enzyme required for sulfatase activity